MTGFTVFQASYASIHHSLYTSIYTTTITSYTIAMVSSYHTPTPEKKSESTYTRFLDFI